MAKDEMIVKTVIRTRVTEISRWERSCDLIHTVTACSEFQASKDLQASNAPAFERHVTVIIQRKT